MYLWLILGLVSLIVGGELLVKGAVGIARKARLSTLVIGMTVVSFGTSAPELFVSIDAALCGSPEIAIGNVAGSNIANIALVLGMTTLIFPIVVNRQSKRIDGPVMMGATLLFYLFSIDGWITFWEGTILFTSLVVFTVVLLLHSRRQLKAASPSSASDQADVASATLPLWRLLSAVVLGLIGLYFGAEWLIKGAVEIAASWGMGKRLIAVTVVALGTSVPELVTSAVAAFRKEADISIGNLIGSNIFNIMAVIGTTAMVKPIAVQEAFVQYDMWWVIGLALVLCVAMVTGKKIGRLKGALLLGIYAAYIALLW